MGIDLELLENEKIISKRIQYNVKENTELKSGKIKIILEEQGERNYKKEELVYLIPTNIIKNFQKDLLSHLKYFSIEEFRTTSDRTKPKGIFMNVEDYRYYKGFCFEEKANFFKKEDIDRIFK